jgi:hypothetical protein
MFHAFLEIHNTCFQDYVILFRDFMEAHVLACEELETLKIGTDQLITYQGDRIAQVRNISSLFYRRLSLVAEAHCLTKAWHCLSKCLLGT